MAPLTQLGLTGAPEAFYLPGPIAPILAVNLAAPLTGPLQEFPEFIPVIPLINFGLQLVFQFLDANGNPLDISGGENLILSVVNPDGSVSQFPAAFWTNGTDGQLAYTTQSGDLQEGGIYYLQGNFSQGGAQVASLPVGFKIVPFGTT